MVTGVAIVIKLDLEVSHAVFPCFSLVNKHNQEFGALIKVANAAVTAEECASVPAIMAFKAFCRNTVRF